MDEHIVIATLSSVHRTTKTRAIFQYNYGMILQFEGVDLPDVYEVHFSNSSDDKSLTQIGDSNGVDIPNEFLITGEDIKVWIFLHSTDNDGETVYHVVIPVIKRAEIGDAEPTPTQVDAISQAIAEFNSGVDRVQTALDTVQDTVNDSLQAAKDSGEFDGPPGEPGTDGISPTVSVEEIDSGHRVTITDAEGDHAFDVLDGQGGRSCGRRWERFRT